ncbi:MAG TPA: fructose-bisphosphatase class II [Leptospiraceae bacterium]|nr:fructose-bisphosphatase class II [Leptospiraceae bacterium]
MNPFHAKGLSLVLATDAASRAVMRWSGKDKKHEADHDAVEAMRVSLDSMPMAMRVLIGEGEKDQAPMLFAGERLGTGKTGDPELDLVVDPLECTTNFSRGLHDSMSVLLAAPSGSIPAIPGTYMTQILLPPSPAADYFASRPAADSIDPGIKNILGIVSKQNGINVSDMLVVVQDRPRHAEIIHGARSAGAGVALIESGSISAAAEILLRPNGRWTLLYGTYGAPEGLILAYMARVTGGYFAGRISPHHPLFAEQARELGLADQTLPASEWIVADGCLCLTGIHGNTFLRGVMRKDQGLVTESLLWTADGVEKIVHENGVQTQRADAVF